MAPDNPQDQNPPPPPPPPLIPTQPPPPAARSDRSAWNWLLLLPIVVPLLTFLYNDEEPRLAGFPAFYWVQLSFILLGVASTVVVYRMTRKRS